MMIRAIALSLFLLGTAHSAHGAIIANLEQPGDFASGISDVQGWAFTTVPGARIDTLIQVNIDGKPAVRVPCCSDRADVPSKFAGAPALSGFSGVFNWGLLARGTHHLEVVITSSAGEALTITRTTATTRFYDIPFVANFQWPADAECSLVNAATPPFEARLACNTALLTRPNGTMAFCTPFKFPFFLGWDVASQSFKFLLTICES